MAVVSEDWIVIGIDSRLLAQLHRKLIELSFRNKKLLGNRWCKGPREMSALTHWCVFPKSQPIHVIDEPRALIRSIDTWKH